MATASNNENLKPSLLDRLSVYQSSVKNKQEAKDQPEDQAPSRDELLARRVASQNTGFSARKVRDVVVRDLNWLFNTSSLDTVMDLSEFPNVASSVVNYGVQGFVGLASANLDASSVERRIREVILAYEPRIIPTSLHVSVDIEDAYSGRALNLEIECKVWSYPAPEYLRITSSMDVESGKVEMRNSRR